MISFLGVSWVCCCLLVCLFLQFVIEFHFACLILVCLDAICAFAMSCFGFVFILGWLFGFG